VGGFPLYQGTHSITNTFSDGQKHRNQKQMTDEQQSHIDYFNNKYSTTAIWIVSTSDQPERVAAIQTNSVCIRCPDTGPVVLLRSTTG
jgi:Uri superfamily endonuclease